MSRLIFYKKKKKKRKKKKHNRMVSTKDFARCFKGEASANFRIFQIKDIVVVTIILKPHLKIPVGSKVTCFQSHINQSINQIFNVAGQLSHIRAMPEKSGLVSLDYWVGLKWCLVIIQN